MQDRGLFDQRDARTCFQRETNQEASPAVRLRSDIDVTAVEADPDASAREAVAPEVLPEAEVGGMPASYRRALGILKGRIVEVDGTPVPDIKVEIYSFEFQNLLRKIILPVFYCEGGVS